MNTSEKDCDHALCDEPLRLAIKNGHYEAARTLLEHGANPNTRYFLGSEINLVSPLDTQFLELLLTFGAYVDSKDRNGMTPLMKACRVAQVINCHLGEFFYRILNNKNLLLRSAVKN